MKKKTIALLFATTVISGLVATPSFSSIFHSSGELDGGTKIATHEMLPKSVSTSGEVDGLWNFRGNGTAIGFLEINEIHGTIRTSGSSSTDAVTITKFVSTGSRGAKEIIIERRGSYNHDFRGWVSSDGTQMAGHYTHRGQVFPWSATK
ncbi:hypothetical protein IQ260_28210 [Leptolyngbya cf. ectocarpi LEGE 11479]|uniref:Uncharacterized protein n=1 Tax=Leptolyngbya cf. ectocarpi LEGE 11479 TaxID=1828722 RepID=A0A929A035_LEPEC|nr:hypothetical protein [Leptolyngbya ectocarpi]MBE9070533.1 hypothetical protein [Leptolyngbya cf. ectocarpi LEGE 11479]